MKAYLGLGGSWVIELVIGVLGRFGSSDGSGLSILGLSVGSSSARRSRNREGQRWPLVNFSSQWKQSPRSRRLAISSGVKCLMGKGGGLGEEGSNGGLGVGVTTERGVGECCGGLG